ncbi:MAG: TolC family protein [Phycisphaerales bacterium]|nr:TolC family protein [Phycisphaerales bacterium]
MAGARVVRETWGRALRCAAAALATCAVGCASYERRPLDESAHWAAFEARLDTLLGEPPATQPAPWAVGAGRGEAGALTPGWRIVVGDGIDAAEAEAIAGMFNGDVRVARAQAQVSLAGAQASGLWRDPVIALDVMRMVDGGMDPWEVLASVGLELPLSGRLEAERALARAMHDADVSRIVAAEWGARQQVREAWVRWEAARREESALAALVQGLESLVATVEAMEKAGEATGLQAGLFRAELSDRRARLAEASAAAEAAALRVVALCGLAPGAAASLAPGGLAEAPVAPARDEALAAARRGSPALATARAEYEAAERELAMAVREGRPDLEIMPGLGRDGGENQVALGVTLPLPLLTGNRRAIAEREQKRELARVMFETEAEKLSGELREAYAMWEGARARAAVVREALEPETEALERSARAVARLGEVDVLMLLEALSRRQDAALMRIETERDEVLARLRIEGLIGPRRSEADAEQER